MIIRLDGNQYYIDEDKFTDYCKGKIDTGLDKKFVVPNGPTIDLRSRSLLATAIRQLLSLLLPTISWAADKIGVELPVKQRHDDIIRYVVDAYFSILKVSLMDIQIDLTSSYYVDDIRKIESFAVNQEDATLPLLLGAQNGTDGFSRSDQHLKMD